MRPNPPHRPASHRLARLALLAAGMAVASPATAYQVGHVPINFSLAGCGNGSVGVEVYYPADVAGDNVAVAAAPAGGFPVVVFGHGFQMIVQAYGNVVDALVPAGYVVALPITGGELFPNHANFGDDLACTVDKLRLEGQNPLSLFHGKIATSAALMGHSMGGGASFLGAAGNPGIHALANFAAANTSPSSITAAATVTVPTLVFSGSQDCVASAGSHQLPMYNATASACKTYVSITGGSHCQFANNNTLCSLGEIFCGSAGISRGTQHQKVNALLLPFLDATLKSDPAAWPAFQTALATTSGITSQQSCSTPPPPACSNGRDDDGDGLADLGDPGCASAASVRENPMCDDGIDNDGDGYVDLADLGCSGFASNNFEVPPASCGMGPGLVVALPLLMAIRGRRRARA